MNGLVFSADIQQRIVAVRMGQVVRVQYNHPVPLALHVAAGLLIDTPLHVIHDEDIVGVGFIENVRNHECRGLPGSGDPVDRNISKAHLFSEALVVTIQKKPLVSGCQELTILAFIGEAGPLLLVERLALYQIFKS